MSMEIYVFSDRRLASIAEWQAAIDAEGFALLVSAETSFGALGGFLPMQLEGRETGCECDHFDAGEIMNNDPDFDYGRRWLHVLVFRWGGDMDACLSAYMAGAAYARATEGCVFDCHEGRVLTPGEAAKVVHELRKLAR